MSREVPCENLLGLPDDMYPPPAPPQPRVRQQQQQQPQQQQRPKYRPPPWRRPPEVPVGMLVDFTDSPCVPMRTEFPPLVVHEPLVDLNAPSIEPESPVMRAVHIRRWNREVPTGQLVDLDSCYTPEPAVGDPSAMIMTPTPAPLPTRKPKSRRSNINPTPQRPQSRNVECEERNAGGRPLLPRVTPFENITGRDPDMPFGGGWVSDEWNQIMMRRQPRVQQPPVEIPCEEPEEVEEDCTCEDDDYVPERRWTYQY